MTEFLRAAQGADSAGEERRQHSVSAGGQQERSQGQAEGVLAGGDPEVHAVGRAIRRNVGQDQGKRGQGICLLTVWRRRDLKFYFFSP